MFEKTGFRTSGLRHIPVEEAFEGILEAGFQTIEFCLEHPEASSASLAAARKAGLEISSVSYHGKMDEPLKRLENGKRAIRMAADCSVDVVVLGSPRQGISSFCDEAFELYNLCRDTGVKPAWETEPGTVLHGLLDFYTYIAALGPFAGINLDAGHLHIEGKCKRHEIRTLGSRIFHVHIEGMNRSEHRHLIPGEGDIDLTALFRGLSEAGYSGSLTIDLFEIPESWRQYLNLSHNALVNSVNNYKALISSDGEANF